MEIEATEAIAFHEDCPLEEVVAYDPLDSDGWSQVDQYADSSHNTDSDRSSSDSEDLEELENEVCGKL